MKIKKGKRLIAGLAFIGLTIAHSDVVAANCYDTSVYIKTEIKIIFEVLNIEPRKAVTSHTILDFFEATPCERKKDGKKQKGYLIQRAR